MSVQACKIVAGPGSISEDNSGIFGLPTRSAPPSSSPAAAATPTLDATRRAREMALTNFVVTVAVVGAAFLLFTTDIRKSGAVFRRNARQIKHWLEEDTASAASRSAKKAALPPKKLDTEIPKEKPKDH